VTRQSIALWLVFAAFVAAAIALEWRADMFALQGSLGAGKYMFWLAFVAFTLYSLYCTTQENLFATIGKIGQWHWGRQVGIDLYIGLLISIFIVGLNEGSLLIFVFWLVPTLIYGNQTTLLYFALNYEQIVGKLLNTAS
jgi:hypothetical protein